MPPSALRDRKRERTRRALLEAAVELFETRGYEATTVADIAATAEVGTRTFFNYFASKEELLFPEPDERVQAAVRAIATRRPGERPVEVLLRALRAAGDNPGDHLGDTLASRISVLRARISRTVPAVSGRAAYAQLASQQEIARQLRTAFPDELDDVGAAALVGAVVGAVSGALTVLFQQPGLEDGEQLHRKIQEITSKVLAPWLNERPADVRPAADDRPRLATRTNDAGDTVPDGADTPGHTAASVDRDTASDTSPLDRRERDIGAGGRAVECRDGMSGPGAGVAASSGQSAGARESTGTARESVAAAHRPVAAIRPDSAVPRHAVRRLTSEPLRRALEAARPLPTERFTVYRAEDGTTRLETPDADPPRSESPWHAPDSARDSTDDLPLPEDALV
ncbi:TetR/AcrR family transcriptional regulator [Nocardia otitidiscaviarum]|uniref:TetR/AcrR family transcriptional regulator n=1 Tax=Nocardia otitidiscaviarum TaxID=1823 RepID=UPI000A56C1DF|nr:TetR/AcrR family transcriptional regulator [Nocardia otitidiscaviarum]